MDVVRDPAPSVRAGAVRVGLVGAGEIGLVHSRALAATPGAATERLAVRRPLSDAARARFAPWRAIHTDWRELTRAADVDLVVVAAPDELHAAIARDALTHGKHVLCEKPLAPRSEESRALAELAERSGRLACVALVLRQWPALRQARALLASGALGRLRRVRLWSRQDHYFPDGAAGWRRDQPAGALQDLGVHALDAAQFLTGQRLADAAAWGVFSPRGTVDGALVVGRLADALATVEVGWAEPGRPWDIGFELAAERGAVAAHWSDQHALRVLRPEQRAYASEPTPDPLTVDGMFARQAAAMLAGIASGACELPDFEVGHRLVELVERLFESAVATSRAAPR